MPKFKDINDKEQWWDGTQWRNIGNTEDEQIKTEYRMQDACEKMRIYNTHPEGVLKCPRCYKMHFLPDNYDNLCDGCCTALLTHPKATEQMITGIKYWRSIAGNLNIPEVKARYDERDKLVEEQEV